MEMCFSSNLNLQFLFPEVGPGAALCEEGREAAGAGRGLRCVLPDLRLCKQV